MPAFRAGCRFVPAPGGRGRARRGTRHGQRHRYAAAAVITGIISLFAIIYINNQNSAQNGVLAENQAEHILINVDSLEISDDVLADYLAENNGLLSQDLFSNPNGEQPLALLEINDQTIGDLLKEIPDGAIKDYITENPEPVLHETIN